MVSICLIAPYKQLLFPALFWLFGRGLGCCFGNFCGFSYFFPALFRLLGLGLRCCFGNFCGFSYFFLLFSGFLGGFGVLFGRFMRFQLLFSWSFSDFWLGLGCCLGNFCGFSYFFLLFPAFFRIFDGVWGAVLRIYAVSATFSCSFTDFGLWFGVLFCEFLRFHLHKTRLLCYQPMAIVHYDNLKIQYFLNKKTKKVNFQKK